MRTSDPRHEWMQLYADGVASAETTARLDAALREDAEFRALFLDYLNLDGALGNAAVLSGHLREKVVAFPVRKARPFLRWLAAAAAIVVALFVVPLFFPKDDAPLGVLTQSVAADWMGTALQPGQKLAPGWLRLRAGVVKIEFARGARVVLEGPAELRLVTDNEGFLQSGKLRAFVPQAAHGFMIRGEGFSAVDRGTEFGVIAGARPEVHVLAGTVAVHGETERLLAKTEGVRFSAGEMEAIPANAALFLSEENVARMEASAALSAHPAALVHYDFRTKGGTMANLVAGHDITAGVTGCTTAEGRWPGASALDFRSRDARVRFTVPGEMRSLTLLAWVRVDSLPNVQSSLMMGGSELPGEVHWYLHREGFLGFAVIAPDEAWRTAHTPVLLRRELFGKWLFLAVTFDGATGMATHYFNGRAVASQVLTNVRPLCLRTVEVGNWGVSPGSTLRASRRVLKEPAGFVRNLHGRVDEFAILSAPLSAAEIQRLYEIGRPATDVHASLSKSNPIPPIFLPK
jgi:hypothetical protein